MKVEVNSNGNKFRNDQLTENISIIKLPENEYLGFVEVTPATGKGIAEALMKFLQDRLGQLQYISP